MPPGATTYTLKCSWSKVHRCVDARSRVLAHLGYSVSQQPHQRRWTLARTTPFGASSHYYGQPLPSAAIATAMSAIEDHRSAVGNRSATIQFDAYGGAINRVPVDATAFVHRTAFCSAQYASFYGTGKGDADRASVGDATGPGAVQQWRGVAELCPSGTRSLGDCVLRLEPGQVATDQASRRSRERVLVPAVDPRLMSESVLTPRRAAASTARARFATGRIRSGSVI